MTSWWSRVRALVRRLAAGQAAERALEDEIQAYVRADVEARVRRGEHPADARRAALAELGGVEQVKERMRDARTGAWLDTLLQDVRYGVRTLAKTPGYSLSVVGSLALGIAAMVSAVAFANGAMFKSFPGVTDQHELVRIGLERCFESHSGCVPIDTTREDTDELRDALTGLNGFAASTTADVAAALPHARSLRASFVTPDFFQVLRASAAIGRTFAAEEGQPARAGAAVLAHHLWTREFDAAPSVLGRVIRVGDQDVAVVGVAPEGFAGIELRLGAAGPDLWVPMPLLERVANVFPQSSAPRRPGERWFRYVGRLAPGTDPPQVQAQADAVAGRIGQRIRIRPLKASVAPLRMHDRAEMASLVGVVLAVPGIVLALACVNVANLLLARGSARAHEIAVRLAIGANRQRIVRQLLTETLLLSLASAVAAVVLVWWAIDVAERYLVIPMPLDAIVIAAAVATGCASALACGLVPAFRVTARAPVTGFHPSQATGVTPRQSRGRRAIVVVQVALSLGLLASGVQLVAALQALNRSGGTPPDRLLMASFDLRQLEVPDAQVDMFYRQLLDRVSRFPQVEAAGLAPARGVWTLHRGKGMDNSVVVWRPEDTPRQGAVPLGGYAGGSLVEALGLRVLQGRAFTDEDRLRRVPQVAIVSRAFSDELMDGSALGATVRVAPRGQPYTSAVEVRIVGVIEDVQEPSYSRDPPYSVATIYLPAPLQPAPALALYIRARESAAGVAPLVRDAVRQVDERVPILLMESLADANERIMQTSHTLARATTLLGGVALLLATWGLYAVVSYTVALRSREIAVRLALGAEPHSLPRVVLSQAMAMAVVGAIIGAGAAFAIGRMIQSEVHVAGAVGVTMIAWPTALLMAVMLVASAIPAARAGRVNLLVLLKEN